MSPKNSNYIDERGSMVVAPNTKYEPYDPQGTYKSVRGDLRPVSCEVDIYGNSELKTPGSINKSEFQFDN